MQKEKTRQDNKDKIHSTDYQAGKQIDRTKGEKPTTTVHQTPSPPAEPEQPYSSLCTGSAVGGELGPAGSQGAPPAVDLLKRARFYVKIRAL